MFLTRDVSLALVFAVLLSNVSPAVEPIRVNVDNFKQAESDFYFAKFNREGGFGKFSHERELAPIDKQTVIRLNRDTLYSFGVFDLDAGPVRVTLPQAGQRYMALQVINEDHYALDVFLQYRAAHFYEGQDRHALRLFRDSDICESQ